MEPVIFIPTMALNKFPIHPKKRIFDFITPSIKIAKALQILGCFHIILNYAPLMGKAQMGKGVTDNNNNKNLTHVMFVTNVAEGYDKPIFYESLKDASDEGTEIIKANIGARCAIYQLRTDMSSEIKITREDFNS